MENILRDPIELLNEDLDIVAGGQGGSDAVNATTSVQDNLLNQIAVLNDLATITIAFQNS